MKEVPNGEEYLDLCDECRNILNNSNYDYKTFPELSLRAWVVSEEDNERVRLAEQASTLGDSGVRETHYWMYAPGEQAYKWDEFYDAGIMGIGWDWIGDLSKYDSK